MLFEHISLVTTNYYNFSSKRLTYPEKVVIKIMKFVCELHNL